MDTEEPNEANRVCRLTGLIENTVSPQLAGQKADLVEGRAHAGVADLGRCRVLVGVGGHEQVRVRGARPMVTALAQPVGHQPGTQVVEVDGVDMQAAAYRDRSVLQVHVGQQEPGHFNGVDGVDGDQADDEAGSGAVQAVQNLFPNSAAQSAGKDLLRK
ncbi:hypothetical protein AB0L68_31015 [Streptomyces sp. NPDC052164]|uniref:hypothetical protein n=1 Tax=Streptomyces sp. NPDC052164 TaxID=3155529 RepID=UPI00342AE2E6